MWHTLFLIVLILNIFCYFLHFVVTIMCIFSSKIDWFYFIIHVPFHSSHCLTRNILPIIFHWYFFCFFWLNTKIKYQIVFLPKTDILYHVKETHIKNKIQSFYAFNKFKTNVNVHCIANILPTWIFVTFVNLKDPGILPLQKILNHISCLSN